MAIRAAAGGKKPKRSSLKRTRSCPLRSAAGDVRIVRTVDALAALYDAWGKPEQVAEWRASLPTPKESLATD